MLAIMCESLCDKLDVPEQFCKGFPRSLLSDIP